MVLLCILVTKSIFLNKQYFWIQQMKGVQCPLLFFFPVRGKMKKSNKSREFNVIYPYIFFCAKWGHIPIQHYYHYEKHPKQKRELHQTIGSLAYRIGTLAQLNYQHIYYSSWANKSQQNARKQSKSLLSKISSKCRWSTSSLLCMR